MRRIALLVAHEFIVARESEFQMPVLQDPCCSGDLVWSSRRSTPFGAKPLRDRVPTRNQPDGAVEIFRLIVSPQRALRPVD